MLLLPAMVLRGQHRVAITIDDLPFVTIQEATWEQRTAWTIRILEALKEHHAPCTGFVNEGKMYLNGVSVQGQMDMLRCWPRYGMDLGNHTRSHLDYNQHSYSEFTEDILNGTSLTRSVLKMYHKGVVYFRHPYLHRGNTPGKVDSVQRFLKEKGYTEAPVTLDNSEWIFARACDKLMIAGDTQKVQELGKVYVHYMEEKLHYYEGQSDTLFHRNISHVLLLHANVLNALFLDDLLFMMEQNGYEFITLTEALKDEAYSSADTYCGNSGISWLHRWALTRGLPKSIFAGEPTTPEWVQDAAGIRE